MPQVIITCDAESGATEIETKGFTGTQCQSETADLKKALGVDFAETPTAEAMTGISKPAQKEAGH